MYLYKTMRNFLLDFNYYIDIYENNFHVFNYLDILKLNNEEIILAMPEFTLILKGNNLVVKRLEKREILISGNLIKMEFSK